MDLLPQLDRLGHRERTGWRLVALYTADVANRITVESVVAHGEADHSVKDRPSDLGSGDAVTIVNLPDEPVQTGNQQLSYPQRANPVTDVSVEPIAVRLRGRGAAFALPDESVDLGEPELAEYADR